MWGADCVGTSAGTGHDGQVHTAELLFHCDYTRTPCGSFCMVEEEQEGFHKLLLANGADHLCQSACAKDHSCRENQVDKVVHTHSGQHCLQGSSNTHTVDS